MKICNKFYYSACLNLLLLVGNSVYAQNTLHPLTQKVNVFLGTSGDHGQLSPGASYPFSMVDIAPQTYPNLHAGYEHKAKLFLGFTHNRVEGVGCQGSGGNLLIKPFMDNAADELIKAQESAAPGYYGVVFRNGISAKFTVAGKAGVEQYLFPEGKHGFFIDLSHALTNQFIAEQHQFKGYSISGWIESGTTCRVGSYRVYYALEFDRPVKFLDSTAHTITVNTSCETVNIRVGFSSVSAAYAKVAINKGAFEKVKKASQVAWNKELNRIQVSGDANEEKLFYSLLYRTMQSPYNISEPDGTYKATNGTNQHSNHTAYNGWSIWDNYKTQLPLLSIIEPDKYGDIVTSIANLYRFGKKNWATKTEPSNTVRTEHAMVVLLDAYFKGYPVDFKSIRDSLLKDADNLDFSKPDKALESSYDTWAMSQVLSILKEDSLAAVYKVKATNWKSYWNKDFKDLAKDDVDEFGARNMYQGTIWQYRWFAPFDMKGLIEQCGGEAAYLKQLDAFFAGDYYNAANEPDIQVPYMYNGTSQPWKSQNIIHKYAKDTVIQYYSDDNYRGINPSISRVYNNRPDGLLLSMDDDAGAMSSWYVLAACGLSPACLGWPVYYLHVPLFRTVSLGKLHIEVRGNGCYITTVTFNGKLLDRNWLTHEEIRKGGKLVIVASSMPNRNFGIQHQFITSIKNN
jgi:putative alpha-1,2-mannosidase